MAENRHRRWAIVRRAFHQRKVAEYDQFLKMLEESEADLPNGGAHHDRIEAPPDGAPLGDYIAAALDQGDPTGMNARQVAEAVVRMGYTASPDSKTPLPVVVSAELHRHALEGRRYIVRLRKGIYTVSRHVRNRMLSAMDEGE